MPNRDPMPPMPPMPGEQQAEADRPLAAPASIFRDPLVKKLSYFAVGLVVLFLVTVISALVMGLADSEQPRTMGEREMRIGELTAVENPEDPEAWAVYIRSLIEQRQFARAQSVIDQVSDLDQTATQNISFMQAALYLNQGRHEAAIETADELRARLEGYHESQLEIPDSPQERGQEIHENYWQALIIKAESYDALGQPEEAIASLDLYIEEWPAAADVLLRRGDLKAGLGDMAGAEEDYRAALTYLPGDPSVLQRLEKIGVEE